jgi:hypothetical protein
VRAKRAPDRQFCARSAPSWLVARRAEQAELQTTTNDERNLKQNGIEIPKIFRGGALRARRFAPGSGRSVADTPHIFCRLGVTCREGPCPAM